MNRYDSRTKKQISSMRRSSDGSINIIRKFSVIWCTNYLNIHFWCLANGFASLVQNEQNLSKEKCGFDDNWAHHAIDGKQLFFSRYHLMRCIPIPYWNKLSKETCICIQVTTTEVWSINFWYLFLIQPPRTLSPRF